MAAINTYLEKIKAAVYGEEVRSSIHDAIKAINEENQTVLTTANTYKDAAETAKTAAESAKTAATQAKTDAESARQTAQSASATATQAASAASQAKEDIDESMSDVTNMRSTMMSDGTILDDLLDSSGDYLLDNNGNRLQGKVVFVKASDFDALQKKLNAMETLLNALLRQTLPERTKSLEDIATYLTNHALIDSEED